MRGPLSVVRPDEYRETAAASLTVLLVMGGHAALETARDTLFLSNVPATRLPWVYLALAALAVLGGPILGRGRDGAGNRRSLIGLQLAAAAGTAVFLGLVRLPQTAVYYALYMWGGIAGTVILVRFWLILTARFTAGQAKRLFPIIAAGAVLGSLTGYGIAALVAWWHQPRALLAASAVLFAASGLASLLWWRMATPHTPAAATAAPDEADAGAAERPRLSIRDAVGHGYVRRITLMLLLTSLSVTVCDFVFKAVVAHAIPSARLGSFIASIYFACDLASAMLLLVAVGPFVRAVGVPTALAVRPALLLAGGILLTAVGGLPAALALRGTDGALRWSLHKTVTELLYVPMSPRLRAAVKEVSDLVSQRGGQALGSLLILAWLAFGGAEWWLGVLLIAGAGCWLAAAVSLRRPYVESFREALSEAGIETQLEFPELDLTSLEALMAALSSPDDDRVVAALDLLAATGRVHVIPALVLYHPAASVVVRALELFAAARRQDVLQFSNRLIGHGDTAVRAAAVRAAALVRPDAEQLRGAAALPCPIVATTALIASAAHGWTDPGTALNQVRDRLGRDDAGELGTSRHVARALRDFPVPGFAPLLAELTIAPDLATRCEAIRAMGTLRDAAHLPILIERLGDRSVRQPARMALLAFGDTALAELERALGDPALPVAIRVHVPRTVSRFGHQRAADLLLRRLLDESSGSIRYKMLRGLGGMRNALPSLALDGEILARVVDDHLAKTFPLVHWGAVLEAGAAEHAQRHTPGHRLLAELLNEKQAFAFERLFRTLGLCDPEAGFAQIYEGLQSSDATARASSRELLEHVLPARWQDAVVGLSEDGPLADRLAAGSAYYAPRELTYEQLVVELIDHPNETVAALASYHAVEIGLHGVASRAERPAADRLGGMHSLRRRSLEQLGEPAAASTGGLRNAG